MTLLATVSIPFLMIAAVYALEVLCRWPSPHKECV